MIRVVSFFLSPLRHPPPSLVYIVNFFSKVVLFAPNPSPPSRTHLPPVTFANFFVVWRTREGGVGGRTVVIARRCGFAGCPSPPAWPPVGSSSRTNMHRYVRVGALHTLASVAAGGALTPRRALLAARPSSVAVRRRAQEDGGGAGLQLLDFLIEFSRAIDVAWTFRVPGVRIW